MKNNTSVPIHKKISLIILDRDGVINHDTTDFIKSPDEFIFLPGSLEAIATLTMAGYQIGIATNQSGLGRGYFTEKTLAQIHHKMLHEIRNHHGAILDVVFCPHLPSDECDCRKPKPGLLLRLIQKANASLSEVVFIGDRVSDLKAAENTGVRSVLIHSTATEAETRTLYPDVPAFASLLESVHYLLARSKV